MASRTPCVGAIALLAACGRLGFDVDGVGGDGGDGLAVLPAVSTINLGSKVALSASGGVPPYTFSLTGEGVLVDTTFIAPSRAGSSTIAVTDARGARAMATIDYRGDRLFVVGGFVGAALDGAVLSSTDGTNWAQVGALPQPRGNGALVVFDDRLFYMGGLNTGDVMTNTVYASSDGVTWAQVGTLPIATTGFTSVVHAGAMWIVGGATSNGDGVAAYRSTDGQTWTPAGSISGARHEHDLISHGGKLYVLGGHGNGLLSDVQSTTDGTSWSQPANVLTFACDFGAAGELGGRAFRICGSGCTTTEYSDDLATWTPGEPLPGERTGAQLVGFNGKLLAIGGAQDLLATTDGTSWSVAGALPAGRTRTAAVQFTPH